jgi:hypothetical protein
MKKQKDPKLKQSETIIIKRSQVNFAPYNPKKHTKEAILNQLKNFKDIGFLGGVAWNDITGNLISGHKRIMAMDIYYNYDGNIETDYDVKVEKASLTEKQEKEQNIFMDARGTNTQQDLGMLAIILPDIDYKAAGLTAEDLNLIAIESPIMDNSFMNEIKSDYANLGEKYEQKKQKIKEAKKKIKEQVSIQQGISHIIISFDSNNNKCEFLERFGFDNDLAIIKGESFSDMIERIK